jgi:TolA-binding protein
MCCGKSSVAALSVLLLAAPAAAQVCGYLEVQKAAKRASAPRLRVTEPEPRRLFAPRTAANLRQEMEEAVRRFGQEVREYERDTARAVRAAFHERRSTMERTYEKNLREIEAEEVQWRRRAIAKLEEFIAHYPDDPVFTPVRMAQLGELYFEESNALFNQQQEQYEAALEAFRKTKQGREPEPPLQRYDKTIAVYRRLVERFPEYKEADGIYYILGYALASQGEERESAQIFERFVRLFPQSPFLPEVWTRLGEYYFDRRPRMLREAIDAYTHVLAFRDSLFFDKALYKLAWAYYLDNQFAAAVKRFEELVEFSDAQKAKLGKAGSDLRAEAIQYIALSFTEETWGGVDKARAWYRSNEQPYVREVLVRLADLLFDATGYKEAIKAYQLALRRFPEDPESPRMQGCTVVAYRLMRDFANEALAAERIPTLFGPGSAWYAANQGNKAALREVDTLAQSAILAAATYHHKQANVFASAGQIGRAKAAYSQAADLYRRFIDRFPTSKDRYEISYYLAETLYYAFRFDEAAVVYERVRDDKEEQTHRLAAAFGAYKSLENWLEAQRFKAPELPRLAPDGKNIEGGPGPDPMPALVQRQIQAGEIFLKLSPRHEQAPNVSYVLAELHYRYKDFPEARRRFEAILDAWPRHKAALNSARLLVDSYRLVQDWTNVEKWSRRLLAMRISEGRDREALREELGKLQTGAAFKRAEALQKAGQYEEAAREYLKLADENPKAEFADVALFNAGANYEQVRKYESANRAYERLLARYPRSPRADKALFRMAVNAENFFEFDRAVIAYLRLYREYKQSDKRDWALYNAALLLENDQQYARAAGYFLTYAREFPEREDAPTSVFRAAKLYLKARDFARARKTFEHFISTYGADGRYRGLALDARAQIADSYATEKNLRAARTEWGKVVEAFDRSGFGPGSPAAVTAARARFLEIEEDFKVFKARKISGSTQRQGELLVELIKEERKLENDYRSVGRFRVLDWYLAALYRIGHLYQLLSQKMLDAPLPSELKTQEEKDAYRTQLEDKAGVLERKAIANFEIAYNEGKAQGVQNEWTRLALEALAVLNPVKYQVLKEPRGVTQIETVSPAPIVRGTTTSVGPPQGEEWKPAGK